MQYLKKNQFRLGIALKKMVYEISSRGNTLKGFVEFDPKRCRRNLAHIIIIDELPFCIMEGEGFQVYSKDLKPSFNIISCHE